MNQIQIIALVIFIITYIGIIFTRLPWMNIDRPSAAFFGSVAMILFGVLSFDEAMAAIDFNTIALLLGMMIVITTLQLDGFFELVARKTIKYAKTSNSLLALIILISSIGSAFMVNDVIVLLFTPIIITLCRNFKINPIPYLIAEILASNIGSAMTITGNPQNMLIGINSGISYSSFLLHLLPISIIGMGSIYMVIKTLYKKEFNTTLNLNFNSDQHSTYNYKSMYTSVPIFGAIIVAFFLSNTLNISIPLIALTGGSLILIVGKIKPSKIIKDIDWVLLLFFASLFIVVKGIEHVGLMDKIKSMAIITYDMNGIGMIHGVSLVFSQIVSNVPLVVAMLPIMHTTQGDLLWLALASASTLAGNATIIGAMANLIVIESAKKEGIHITFMEYFKSGIIVTVLSFVISILILWLELELLSL